MVMPFVLISISALFCNMAAAWQASFVEDIHHSVGGNISTACPPNTLPHLYLTVSLPPHAIPACLPALCRKSIPHHLHAMPLPPEEEEPRWGRQRKLTIAHVSSSLYW